MTDIDRLLIWKTIFNKSAARYTERQSLETLDYRTAGAEYSELLYNIIYFITERECESGEKEDKVCCSKDDSEVGRLRRVMKRKHFLLCFQVGSCVNGQGKIWKGKVKKTSFSLSYLLKEINTPRQNSEEFIKRIIMNP